MKRLNHRAAEVILARHTYGRLGCFSPHLDETYVVPVSYEYRDGSIYFGCLPGKKLEFLRAHPTGVSFEVDDIDDESDWVSVIATGRFEELSGMEFLTERPLAIERAERGPLRTSLNAARRHLRTDLVLCAIRVERISGRRDQRDWSLVEDAPAHVGTLAVVH